MRLAPTDASSSRRSSRQAPKSARWSRVRPRPPTFNGPAPKSFRTPSEKDANRLAAASPLARRGWLRSRLRAPTDVMCRATQRFLKALRLVSRPARDLPLEHALEETRDMQVTTFRLDTSGGVSLFVYRWLLVIPPLRAVAPR